MSKRCVRVNVGIQTIVLIFYSVLLTRRFLILSSFTNGLLPYLISQKNMASCLQLHCIGQGILKGEVSLYQWPPVWLVWNQLYDYWQFCFYLQNRLIQTSQTGQWYSDTSPFNIPCIGPTYPSHWKRIRRPNNSPKHF